MQKRTRSEVVKMVCELVEKAYVPGDKPEITINVKRSTGVLVRHRFESVEIDVGNPGWGYIPGDNSLGVWISIWQQHRINTAISDGIAKRLSAVTALAVSIEAALKEVEVVE